MVRLLFSCQSEVDYRSKGKFLLVFVKRVHVLYCNRYHAGSLQAVKEGCLRDWRQVSHTVGGDRIHVCLVICSRKDTPKVSERVIRNLSAHGYAMDPYKSYKIVSWLYLGLRRQGGIGIS